MFYAALTLVCVLGIFGILPIPLPYLLGGVIAALAAKAFLPSNR